MLDVLPVVLAALVLSLISLYLSFTSWLRLRKTVAVVRAYLGARRSRLVKPRKRYLVFEVVALSGELSGIGRGQVEEAIERSCRLLFGFLGYGSMRPTLVYYDESGGVGILGFKHLWRNHVLLLLSLVREIGGAKVIVVPVATTGTRRKAMKIATKSQ
ncbi:MAG: Rpp14/Pop5 family protein [Sulfolobales archaeon]|nr:hypothetical protein [Sulfolobales archaeon]MCX8209109.1 hypothetical protein [Sulfolobales archaeon]MDW8010389.1 Rpp14/Pop5 family protein [Sulfolobales archaeon]